MKMKVKKLFILIFTIVLILQANVSRATLKTKTKEDLEEGLGKILELETDNEFDNENNLSMNFEYNITDDVMNLIIDGKEYSIKYDLQEDPTFTYEVQIENGMTYEQYSEEVEMILIPIYGYIAIAINEGVKIESAVVYPLLNIMGSALSSNNLNVVEQDDFIYYDSDKINMSDLENYKSIKKSEFSNNVMDFVNTVYENDITYSDSESINSFTLTVDKENVANDSCNLVATLTINQDADFSKIEQAMNDLEQNLTAENTESNTNNDRNETIEENTTSNITSIPKAGVGFGIKDILKIIILISVLSIIIILITNRRGKIGKNDR